jgi:hypothetical protein
MALGNGCVSLPEESANGGPDDIRSTNHDDIRSRQIVTSRVDELNDTSWCAGGKVGFRQSRAEETDVFGVETVDILGDDNRVDDHLFLVLCSAFEGELDQDTRDLAVGVGLLDEVKDFLDTRSLETARLGIRGNGNVLDRHAALFGCLLLHSNVGRRGSIGSELENDEVGLVKGRVGSVEVIDGLGYVLTDRPGVSITAGGID